MMKKGILTLLLFLFTALPAIAATETSGPWGVSVKGLGVSFGNLSSILQSPVTVGKTVVIDKICTINNKTISNRRLKFVSEGRIDIGAAKTLAFSPTASVEPLSGQMFGGEGAVTGLIEASVLSFGALGQGADETTLIQKTVNAAQKIDIPATSAWYVTSANIDVPSGRKIKSNHAWIKSSADKAFAIMSNTVAGTTLAADTAIGDYTITVANGAAIPVGTHILITYYPTYGGGDTNIVTNLVGNVATLKYPVSYAFPSGRGVETYTPKENITIDGLKMTTSAGWAFYSQNAKNYTLLNNVLVNCWSGATNTGALGLTLINNSADRSGVDGVSGVSFGTHTSKDVLFFGNRASNQIYDEAFNAYLFNYNVKFSYNTAQNSAGAGILIDKGNIKVMLSNNTVDNAAGQGIYTAGSPNNIGVTAINNTVSHSGLNGLWFNGTDGGYAAGNSLYNNGQYGLQVTSANTNVEVGENYYFLNTAGNLSDQQAVSRRPVTRKALTVIIPYTTWVAAATSQSFLLGPLPPKTRLVSAIAYTTTPYAGLAGTIALKIGASAGSDTLLLSHDVKSAAIVAGDAAGELGSDLATPLQGGIIFSMAGAQNIYATLTSSVGNLGNGTVTTLTAGETIVYFTYEEIN